MTPALDKDFAALVEDARGLLDAFRTGRFSLATAESCTGGLIAGILTEVPGSSVVLERGFVTYSNEAKTEMLGVPAALIKAEGAVSEAVSRSMATGALARSRADIAVAVTGIAGPDGGTKEKPVGLVHLAAASREGKIVHREIRLGDIGRQRIRLATVAEAFILVRELI